MILADIIILIFRHSHSGCDRDKLLSIAKSVGVAIGKLHDAEIVHGDLTTSNLMIKATVDGELTSEVMLIDFGLGMMKPTMEDKAVDLYVLERAFTSTHPGSENLVRTQLLCVNYFRTIIANHVVTITLFIG